MLQAKASTNAGGRKVDERKKEWGVRGEEDEMEEYSIRLLVG